MKKKMKKVLLVILSFCAFSLTAHSLNRSMRSCGKSILRSVSRTMSTSIDEIVKNMELSQWNKERIALERGVNPSCFVEEDFVQDGDDSFVKCIDAETIRVGDFSLLDFVEAEEVKVGKASHCKRSIIAYLSVGNYSVTADSNIRYLEAGEDGIFLTSDIEAATLSREASFGRSVVGKLLVRGGNPFAFDHAVNIGGTPRNFNSSCDGKSSCVILLDTKVTGDITFACGKGKVIMAGSSSIEGSVIGGWVTRMK